MAEQQLQSRLNAVFGSLSRPGEEPSWQPTAEQVFRTGAPITDHDASSDEEAEYKERARREVVPGLAMDLAAEDEADEEGFKPSTAFCRALDREVEYSEVDEIATGTYRGRALDSLPPRSMEVLEDNVWEQQIALREGRRQDEVTAISRLNGGDKSSQTTAQPIAGTLSQAQQQGGAAAWVQQARMEGQHCNPAANGAAPQGGPDATGAGGGENGAREDRKAGVQKRVRFQGVPQPWVPPHRREGYVSRDPQDTLPPAETSAGPSANRKPAQRGVAQSRVPHHVQHPEKYTLYTLEEPLVVGGGTGQLGSERQEQLEQAANWAKQSHGEGARGGEDAAAEPARWQGTVGGGIQFRPKVERQLHSDGHADVDMTGHPPGPSTSSEGRDTHPGPAGARGVQLAFEGGYGEDGGEDGGDGQPGGVDVAMDAGVQPQAQGGGEAAGRPFKAVKVGRRARGYRSRTAAPDMGQGRG